MTAVDISPIPRLAIHAHFHSDKTALVYEGQEISFANLYVTAGSLAAALREDGVGPGDRVAYAGMNSANFLLLYLAATWIGAVFVPVNFRLAAAEIRSVLEDSRPDVVLAEPAHAALIDPFSNELPVRRLLLIDDDPNIDAEVSLAADWMGFTAFYEGHPDAPLPVHQHQDDLAALLYTSGTTGRPKGVMLTHGNLWWNQINVDSVVDTRVDDVNLSIAPLFHIGGINTFTLRAITRGSTTVIRRAFNPAQTVRDLVEYKVSGMFAVAAMLAAVQREEAFEHADLSALRSTIVAGAPVPPSIISRWATKGVLLQQAWGLTETAPFSTYLEASRTEEKIGSCGTPMPYTEVRVMDVTTGQWVIGAGESGELWVRGPNVAGGYWNNEAASESAFTPDGWFRTGDIGYVDDEGYIFIIDRLKDMIISGGENIYPAEVERVLSGHPHLADVAVVGVADEKWGEAVCAVVSLTANAPEMTLEALREFAALGLARYKLPTRFQIVKTVPRNGAGKLDKPAIRKSLESTLAR